MDDQNNDVYVSYTHSKFIDEFKDIINTLKNTFKVWFDLEKLNDTSNLVTECFNGISNSKIFLCCLSSEYYLNNHCMRELMLADTLKKPIVFVLFENVNGLRYDEILMKIGPPSFLVAGNIIHHFNQVENINRHIQRLLTQ